MTITCTLVPLLALREDILVYCVLHHGLLQHRQLHLVEPREDDVATHRPHDARHLLRSPRLLSSSDLAGRLVFKAAMKGDEAEFRRLIEQGGSVDWHSVDWHVRRRMPRVGTRGVAAFVLRLRLLMQRRVLAQAPTFAHSPRLS